MCRQFGIARFGLALATRLTTTIVSLPRPTIFIKGKVLGFSYRFLVTRFLFFFRNQREHPPRHPVSTLMTPPEVGGGEPCAAPCCCLPQEETVAWVQCDGCDLWFHVACVGCSIQAAREADFRCPGCHMGFQT